MNSYKQNPVLCFRRWSRKGYAVFASLGKVVKIGVVTFGCSLVQQEYQPIFAQADSSLTSRDRNLDSVEISESQPKLWSGLARAVSVMDQKEIAASPLRSLDNLLEQVTGLDVRQRGTDGVQADLSVRGGSFDQVMILLNGVNITDPQTGHYSLDIPVDLQQIQRIEILQGSGSRIWGPNAFSGAINIFTTPNASNHRNSGSLEIGAGSFGYRNLSATCNLQKGLWQLGGSVSHKKSEGYTKNTDFDLFNSHIQATYNSQSNGTFQLQLAYQQKSFGANSFYSFKYPNQFERTKTIFSALNWDKTIGKTTLQAQIYQRQHHDRFELFRSNTVDAPAWYQGHNFHQTDVTGGNIKALQKWELGKTVVGMEFRNEHIVSNVLGEPMIKTKTDFLDKDAIFTKEKNRINYRGFIDHSIYFGLWNLSAGLSGNYNSDFGRYLNGGMDAGYEISSNIKAYINWNQAVRLPTFTDLYYNSPTQISNRNLKPELSNTYELGFKYQFSGFKVSTSTYYREGKNGIDWIKQPDSIKWESRNLTKIHAFGGDITTQYQFHKGILQNIRLSYAYLNLDKKANGFDSKYALDYLKHKISLHLETLIVESRTNGNINAAWNLNWQDRSGDYTDISTIKKDYKPYWLNDVRIQWRKKAVGIYADVNNIFNVKYADFGGLTQAGFSFRTGIKITL